MTLKQTVIVDRWLKARVAELKKSVSDNFKATGAAAESIEGRIEGEAAIIDGASYLFFGENGRGKTVNGGNGTLKELIRKWIDVKGITPRELNMSKDTLAFLITRKIHREGIKVPNQYNKGKMLSSVLTEESINDLLNEYGATILGEFESEIIKQFELQ